MPFIKDLDSSCRPGEGGVLPWGCGVLGEEIPKSMCNGKEGLLPKLTGFYAPASPSGHRNSLCSSVGIAGPAVVINEDSKEICFWGHSNNRCRDTA